MAPGATDLLIRLLVNSRGVDKGLNEVKGKFSGWARDIRTGIAQGIGQALFGAVTGGLRTMVAQIPLSIKATSNLTESINKAGVVFGANAKDILAWSKTAATALGQSQQQALEAAGSFGNLFTSMGVTRKESARLSVELVELASDLASFNNIRPEDALEKLRAGIVGETEPLRVLGININETVVKAEAMALGLGKGNKMLTDQEKILARYSIIMRQSANAQGDFARTSQDVANQQRILAAQIENSRAKFGQVFLPIYTEILRGLNLLMGQVAQQGDGIMRTLATAMVNGVIYLLPVIRTVRDLFRYWFETHSPPRILPDLAKWGAGAMQEYLKGWGKADFGGLTQLGGALESILRSFVGTGQIQEGDLISRVFGGQDAIRNAINEWRQLGSVSTGALDAIARAAAPAGESVAGLVRAYFDLQGASQRAAQAQDNLTRVTSAYDRILSPLRGKLDDLQDKQQELQDNRRLFELDQIIGNKKSSSTERQLAQLEKQEIQLRSQMDAVEEERDVAVDSAQKKLDAARLEESAAQDRFDIQQAALDQQVKLNTLIAEQIAADKAHSAELERLYQAQLNYNLATTDTAGKIALMKLELGRHTAGSVEYYNILTQIAGLEEQLKKEREAGGALVPPEAILPPVEGMDIPSWSSELATKLRTEIEKALGEKPDFGGPFFGADSEILNPKMGPPPKEISETSQAIKDFVGAIDTLVDAITGVTTPLEALVILFGGSLDEMETKAEESGKKLTELEQNQQAQRLNYLSIFIAATKGDWGGMWDALVEAAKLGWEENRLAAEAGFIDGDTTMKEGTATWKETWIGWLEDFAALGEQWGADLEAAGAAAMASFWKGITDWWDETIVPGWTGNLKWLRDQLPFSEPKDPSSPLRGLEQSGASIIGQIQRGMEGAALTLSPSIAANLVGAGASGAVSTTNNHLGPISLSFSGPVTDGMIRNAARTLDEELRSRGWR